MGNVPQSHFEAFCNIAANGQLNEYDRWLLKRKVGVNEWRIRIERDNLLEKKKRPLGRHGRVNFRPTKYFRAKRSHK